MSDVGRLDRKWIIMVFFEDKGTALIGLKIAFILSYLFFSLKWPESMLEADT